MNPVYVISDLHLRAQRPELNRRLSAFIEDIFLPAGETLYILGDLFEYWIGDDAADQLGYCAQIDLLKSLVEGGKNVYFMHGNRDFLVGQEFCAHTGVRLLDDPAVIALAGRRCLLKHGDDLCTDDTEHQQFRKMTRDPAWQRSVLEKSIPERFQLASQMRQMSGSSYKPSMIMDVNRDAVKSTMQDYGAQVLIHGHTHRPGRHRFEAGGRSMERIVLGDWDRGASYLQVDDTGFHLVTPDD